MKAGIVVVPSVLDDSKGRIWTDAGCRVDSVNETGRYQARAFAADVRNGSDDVASDILLNGESPLAYVFVLPVAIEQSRGHDACRLRKEWVDRISQRGKSDSGQAVALDVVGDGQILVVELTVAVINAA